MLIIGNDQISRIGSCAKEEVASFLRPCGVNAYANHLGERLPENTCWDGQLQTKTSEVCLDSEMLLHLMAMSGILKDKGSEAQEPKPQISKPSKLRKVFKAWRSLSSLRAKVKRTVLRSSRYVCESPALECEYPTEQSAISDCSTSASDSTVVHNEMVPCCVAKPNSTTNVLRLI